MGMSREDWALDAMYEDSGDECGPDCRATLCCHTASEAARRYCGCGGGLDHEDCPEVVEDWRAWIGDREVGAGRSEDEALADAESVTDAEDWPLIVVGLVG